MPHPQARPLEGFHHRFTLDWRIHQRSRPQQPQQAQGPPLNTTPTATTARCDATPIRTRTDDCRADKNNGGALRHVEQLPITRNSRTPQLNWQRHHHQTTRTTRTTETTSPGEQLRKLVLRILNGTAPGIIQLTCSRTTTVDTLRQDIGNAFRHVDWLHGFSCDVEQNLRLGSRHVFLDVSSRALAEDDVYTVDLHVRPLPLGQVGLENPPLFRSGSHGGHRDRQALQRLANLEWADVDPAHPEHKEMKAVADAPHWDEQALDAGARVSSQGHEGGVFGPIAATVPSHELNNLDFKSCCGSSSSGWTLYADTSTIAKLMKDTLPALLNSINTNGCADATAHLICGVVDNDDDCHVSGIVPEEPLECDAYFKDVIDQINTRIHQQLFPPLPTGSATLHVHRVVDCYTALEDGGLDKNDGEYKLVLFGRRELDTAAFLRGKLQGKGALFISGNGENPQHAVVFHAQAQTPSLTSSASSASTTASPTSSATPASSAPSSRQEVGTSAMSFSAQQLLQYLEDHDWKHVPRFVLQLVFKPPPHLIGTFIDTHAFAPVYVDNGEEASLSRIGMWARLHPQPSVSTQSLMAGSWYVKLCVGAVAERWLIAKGVSFQAGVSSPAAHAHELSRVLQRGQQPFLLFIATTDVEAGALDSIGLSQSAAPVLIVLLAERLLTPTETFATLKALQPACACANVHVIDLISICSPRDKNDVSGISAVPLATVASDDNEEAVHFTWLHHVTPVKQATSSATNEVADVSQEAQQQQQQEQHEQEQQHVQQLVQTQQQEPQQRQQQQHVDGAHIPALAMTAEDRQTAFVDWLEGKTPMQWEIAYDIPETTGIRELEAEVLASLSPGQLGCVVADKAEAGAGASTALRRVAVVQADRNALVFWGGDGSNVPKQKQRARAVWYYMVRQYREPRPDGASWKHLLLVIDAHPRSAFTLLQAGRDVLDMHSNRDIRACVVLASGCPAFSSKHFKPPVGARFVPIHAFLRTEADIDNVHRALVKFLPDRQPQLDDVRSEAHRSLAFSDAHPTTHDSYMCNHMFVFALAALRGEFMPPRRLVRTVLDSTTPAEKRVLMALAFIRAFCLADTPVPLCYVSGDGALSARLQRLVCFASQDNDQVRFCHPFYARIFVEEAASCQASPGGTAVMLRLGAESLTRSDRAQLLGMWAETVRFLQKPREGVDAGTRLLQRVANEVLLQRHGDEFAPLVKRVLFPAQRCERSGDLEAELDRLFKPVRQNQPRAWFAEYDNHLFGHECVVRARVFREYALADVDCRPKVHDCIAEVAVKWAEEACQVFHFDGNKRRDLRASQDRVARHLLATCHAAWWRRSHATCRTNQCSEPGTGKEGRGGDFPHGCNDDDDDNDDGGDEEGDQAWQPPPRYGPNTALSRGTTLAGSAGGRAGVPRSRSLGHLARPDPQLSVRRQPSPSPAPWFPHSTATVASSTRRNATRASAFTPTSAARGARPSPSGSGSYHQRNSDDSRRYVDQRYQRPRPSASATALQDPC
ncbi:hypothetical protein PTSG_06649 [Salpingoeca rosetta]|uniref:Uncharacterized protein n=1 Tax=Salpingoeca rosetta (strain ATCC 50818 / BSB-021) TaxID=946362 RepID=F2UFL2_SALR5|nr:uncharacterized protein PTSG_06649 [Salpingoeca rosetta]EGD75580.1 hypothetical protein PTSG_06649 [Salpingoeca rosetta]|eukprot:XP_004992037.1 hypothetical protein PTSG_06649 [Salpingoeca rosetta]